MTVDHRRRLQLYEVARERFGSDAADTLMELLPPVDPSNIATKDDLAILRAEMRTEMADLRTEVSAQLREQTTRLIMFVVPSIFSAVGLAIAASHIS